MARKLVIDSCSLIYFFRYYQFGSKDGEVYKKLREFIISKIREGEIVIIDKVDGEMSGWLEDLDFKRRIGNSIMRTESLNPEVRRLAGAYCIQGAESRGFMSNGKRDENKYQDELNRFLTRYADLFLVACCNSLKAGNNEVALITEENDREFHNSKLMAKIPTICMGEKITYKNLPHMLFEIYKNELKFDLNAQPRPLEI